MRFTRKKQIRRVLRWYNTCFGFHAPYHCLIDLSFIEHSLQNRLNIRDQLETIFGKVTPCVTACLLEYLKNQGNRMSGPFKVASQYYRLNCACSNTPTVESVQKCMQERLLEKTFILCSCNTGMKGFARRAPLHADRSRAIPLVTIQGQVPVLEGPSDEAKELVARNDRGDDRGNKIEKSLEDTEIVKKKKSTNPNPLSVKKKISKDTKPRQKSEKKTRRSRRSIKSTL